MTTPSRIGNPGAIRPVRSVRSARSVQAPSEAAEQPMPNLRRDFMQAWRLIACVFCLLVANGCRRSPLNKTFTHTTFMSVVELKRGTPAKVGAGHVTVELLQVVPNPAQCRLRVRTAGSETEEGWVSELSHFPTRTTGQEGIFVKSIKPASVLIEVRWCVGEPSR